MQVPLAFWWNSHPRIHFSCLINDCFMFLPLLPVFFWTTREQTLLNSELTHFGDIARASNLCVFIYYLHKNFAIIFPFLLVSRSKTCLQGSISSNSTKEQLVNIVQPHFSSQVHHLFSFLFFQTKHLFSNIRISNSSFFLYIYETASWRGTSDCWVHPRCQEAKNLMDNASPILTRRKKKIYQKEWLVVV